MTSDQSMAYRISVRILVASMAVSTLAMTALALFAEANGDDFCRGKLLPLISSVASWHRAPDVPSYVADSWRLWTGRWAATAVETQTLATTSFTQHYWALVIPVWITLLGSLLVGVQYVLTPHRVGRIALGSTAILWALFWAGMPGPGDGLFWFTGAVENVLPIGLVLATLVAISRGSGARGARRLGYFTAAGVGCVVVPGMHELHGLSLLSVLLVVGLVSLHSDRRQRTPWLLAAALTFLSMLVVIAAPGNRIRAGYFPTPDVLKAILIAGWQAFHYLPDWIVSVPLLSASIIFVTHPEIAQLRPVWIDRSLAGRRRWLAPAVTLLLVGFNFAGPAYAMSHGAPTRTLTGAYLIFLIGWFLTLLIFFRRPVHQPDEGSHSNVLLTGAILALAASLTLQGNTRTALVDLATRASPWQESRRDRYRVLRAASRTGGTVVLPSGPPTPELFFALDIVESSAGWRNECVAGYFGVPSVSRAGTATTQESD